MSAIDIAVEHFPIVQSEGFIGPEFNFLVHQTVAGPVGWAWYGTHDMLGSVTSHRLL